MVLRLRNALIIGAGAMGEWFAIYLKTKHHYNILLHDLNQQKARKLARKIRGKIVKNLGAETLNKVELIIVSTPISETPRIIEQVTEMMDGNYATVVEISSVKSDVIKKIKQTLRRRKKYPLILSIHPLFGPGVESLKGQNIVVIPVIDRGRETKAARRLFPKAKLSVMNYQEHDRMVAYTLSLMRLVLLTILNNWKPYINKPKTTSQKLLLLTASTLINESPALFTQIIKTNPYTREAVKHFLETFKEISKTDIRKLTKIYNKTRNEYKVFMKTYSTASKIAETLVIT